MADPYIYVASDFDGYFEAMVRAWVKQKTTPFTHSRIVVSAGPYRLDAVTTRSYQGAIYIDFYSALRTGFGHISNEEIDIIIGQL